MSQRSLRSSRARRFAHSLRPRGSFGPYTAALAVAVATLTATPALASVPAPPPVTSGGHASAAMDTEAAEATQTHTTRETTEAQAAPRSRGEYKGRVTARTGLLLRDRPSRGGRVIGSAAYGSIVHILCKTRGESVNDNNRWYLLTDGAWAWGSAAYIDNIGKAPRWC